MSRSYHATGRSVARRVKNGEPEAIHELTEKKAIKETIKKYRAKYPEACPSAKSTKLKNSFVVATVKKVLTPKKEPIQSTTAQRASRVADR